MRATLAFLRAGWLTATSYRLNMTLSLVAVAGAVVPVYFIAGALQPVMGHVIRGEGSQYFGFVLVGTLTYSFVPIAVQALPGAVAGSIGDGTMEAVLGTPTSVPAMLTGMMAYSFLWTAARAVVMLIAGWAFGAAIDWAQLPLGLVVLLLVTLAYVPIGLLIAAAYIAFRSTGPVAHGTLIMSALLGGVYYPTHVIPSWLQQASQFVPLAYGLRPLRRILLDAAPISAVANDLAILSLMALVSFVIAGVIFAAAMRYARRIGSLGYY